MKKSEFKRRRQQLMQTMGENSIAIIPCADEQQRNRDVSHRYRQDSDFYYLTGFNEANSIAVLIPERKAADYILFCPEKDKTKTLWDGEVAGQEGAVNDFGAADSFPTADLSDILPGLIEQCDKVFYAMGCNAKLDHLIPEWMNKIRQQSRQGIHGPTEIIALDHYLSDMRLYKSAAELHALREAIDISSKGHIKLMQVCEAGINERELEAQFIYHCFIYGTREQAYPSIVGSGKNACTLHYIDNKDICQEGDLILIDAGCEVDLYASDITRTFPVNGVFSTPQKQIYELVLRAQEAAINEVKPGNHWNQPHEAATKVIVEGLIALKLLKGTIISNIEKETYKKFFPHRTGHWLGMDVHDVGDYKAEGEWRVFEEDMVLTVEPGIYIPETKGVAKKWWNIGVRIEDDILVTKAGHEVLSANCPKTVKEIEEIMANGKH